MVLSNCLIFIFDFFIQLNHAFALILFIFITAIGTIIFFKQYSKSYVNYSFDYFDDVELSDYC